MKNDEFHHLMENILNNQAKGLENQKKTYELLKSLFQRLEEFYEIFSYAEKERRFRERSSSPNSNDVRELIREKTTRTNESVVYQLMRKFGANTLAEVKIIDLPEFLERLNEL